MSLLLLLRTWLGGGEPPAPAQAYRLRGTIARAGGPGGSLAAVATLTGTVAHVG